MTRDQVESIRSLLGEAEHYLRQTPDEQIDQEVIADLLGEALRCLKTALELTGQ